MLVMGCKIVTAADFKALHVDLLPMFFCPSAFCHTESSFCTLVCLRSTLQHKGWLYRYNAITARLDTPTNSLVFECMPLLSSVPGTGGWCNISRMYS